MISNLSSAHATDGVQQSPAVKLVPSSPLYGAASNEDTVQLSAETQKHLANIKTAAAPAQPSMEQIIKEAANGDINALAKLALVA